ncbi:MAG: TetR/AcrR family transcriptional regulator [Flavobacteriaceae bacterium]|nr:TetR/AcrR family transcriptional regulator [Flavobacteriaceae bacterium]
MKNIQIHIQVSPDLYLKNPDSSDLGRNIVSKSIELINEMGFEDFTFKKLGLAISSPESSVYRYFKNKHMLLVYLTSWYWAWTEYRIVFATTNIESPKERLLKAINILTKPALKDNSFTHIDEVLLSEIIFSESIKAYHTKSVDEDNKKGYFKAYKRVVQRVSDIVLEIASDFKNPHMLISTVIEGSHQQNYFAKHLPSLTDNVKEQNAISNFYTELTLNFLKINN